MTPGLPTAARPVFGRPSAVPVTVTRAAVFGPDAILFFCTLAALAALAAHTLEGLA